MSGITIPTLDEITGHTVMAKLRSLCKRFIGLAEEVDEKIDAPLEEAHLAVQTANATLATAQDAVTTANSASAIANEASESAQESAETVAGYDTRLTAVENGKINITDINNYAVGLTGNQNVTGNKINLAGWNKYDTVIDKTVTPTGYREMANVWYDKNMSVIRADKVIAQSGVISTQNSIRRTINGHELEAQLSISISDNGTTSITAKDANGNYHALYSWVYTGDLS